MRPHTARSWLRTTLTKVRSVRRRTRRDGHGSRGSIDRREEGDACVIGGMTGTLVETGDGLVCIPNEWEAADAASLSDREIAHLQYIDRISNAWRTPDGDVVSDHRPARVRMRRRHAMR